MEVLQVLKYSIREQRREHEQRRGFAGPDSDPQPHVLPADGPALSEDSFSPGRMSDVLRAIREDSHDESVT